MAERRNAGSDACTANGNVTLPRYDASQPTERLWTIEDVADFIRVPVATIRKWRHRGHPLGRLGVRLGKRVIWDPEDVRSWWEKTKSDSAAAQ